MKTYALLAVGAGLVAAQQMSDLPACGQTCVSNMIAIATSEFGCAKDDVACYCSKAKFGYGLRDCSNEACGSDVAQKVAAFGTSYCQNAIASAGSASASAATTGALPVLTTVVDPATASSGNALSSAIGSATESANSAVSSAASAASSALESAASGASSAAKSGASAATSALKSGESAASSALNSATGGSSAGAPMKTAFPMAGAAGMAALLLL